MKFRFMLWDVLCTGKAWIKPANWLNPLDNGPQQMAPCEGGALYYKADIVAKIMSWGHSNKCPLPDRASAQGEKVPSVEPINWINACVAYGG